MTSTTPKASPAERIELLRSARAEFVDNIETLRSQRAAAEVNGSISDPILIYSSCGLCVNMDAVARGEKFVACGPAGATRVHPRFRPNFTNGNYERPVVTSRAQAFNDAICRAEDVIAMFNKYLAEAEAELAA